MDLNSCFPFLTSDAFENGKGVLSGIEIEKEGYIALLFKTEIFTLQSNATSVTLTFSTG